MGIELIILLVVLFIISLVIYDFFNNKEKKEEHTSLDNPVFDMDSRLDTQTDSIPVIKNSDDEEYGELPYFNEKLDQHFSEDDFFFVKVVATKNKFSRDQLLEFFEDNNIVQEESFYHFKKEETIAEGTIINRMIFSIANCFGDGKLDILVAEPDFTTSKIMFFMIKYKVNQPLEAFEDMIASANKFAQTYDGIIQTQDGYTLNDHRIISLRNKFQEDIRKNKFASLTQKNIGLD